MTPRFPFLALCSVMIAGAAAVRSPGSVGAASNDQPWGSITIPAGFSAARQAVHVAGSAEDWRTIPLLIEQSFAGPDGLRIVRQLRTYADDLRRLRAQGNAPATADDVAPLPLGVEFWQRRFEPVPPPHDLLWAILSSREMSSLYYGLLALDDATLRAIQADEKLSTALVRRARAVPVLAPALRIRDGRVVPPGSPGAAPLWQELVGKPLDRPAQFVEELLRRDEGQLAHFYCVISALPADTVTWLVGGSAPADSRREQFERLYAAFSSALDGWRADAMVQPPAGGPADLLFGIVTRSGGTLAGPPWRGFWRRAFDEGGWPGEPEREVAEIEADDLLDAASLLELICPGKCDPARRQVFAFVQREFPNPDLTQAPAVLAASRTRARYPSLALEIERMRLADAAVYARLGSMAAIAEHLPEPAQTIALVQMQSAIALLSRLRAVGAPASLVREQVTALAAFPLTRHGFDGALVRWLSARIFTTKHNADVDDAAGRMLAGDGWQKQGAILEWEGTQYRVDIVATEQARIKSVRERFSGHTLTTAAHLVRLADSVSAAVASGGVDDLIAGLTGALGPAPDIEQVSWTGSRSKFENLDELPEQVADMLRNAQSADKKRIERAAGKIRAAADLIAADALAALVYALALQDVDNPLAMSAELPRRHYLQPASPTDAKRTAWELPEERHPQGGVRHIAGSLLGLDAGVPTLSIRRISSARPPHEPNMAVEVVERLQRTAALTSPWTVATEDLAAIAAARARGEAIVDGWTAETLDRSLDAAAIVGPRAGWLRWSVNTGKLFAPAIRLEDLVRLGGWPARPEVSWGVADEPSLCVCLMMPGLTWEARGQPRHPRAATVVEPLLRVALELHDRGLPAALAPGVLVLLTNEVVDHALLPYPTDVSAIIDSIRRVPRERFDDYIAAVAARGPVVRVSEGDR